MALASDVVYLILTLGVLGGSVAVILFIVKRFTEFTNTTKEKLKSRGYEISDQGVAVHTERRLDREDYIDKSRGGLVKAFNASSYGKKGEGKQASSIFEKRRKS